MVGNITCEAGKDWEVQVWLIACPLKRVQNGCTLDDFARDDLVKPGKTNDKAGITVKQ